MSLYSPIPRTQEELYKLVSDEEILYFYFGEFAQDAWYLSPFREEKAPSFTISYYKNNWVWRDFGITTKPNDGVEYVKQLYNISFHEAIAKIYEEIIEGNGISTKIVKKVPQIKEKKIVCKIWKPKFKSTIDYWLQYNITIEDLYYYNIYEGMIWINGSLVMRSTKYKHTSIYVFDKINKIWKGYTPKAKKDKELKFFSHNIGGHIQNWEELSKTHNRQGLKYHIDILFITKSYKDCIVLNKLGYHAIAPHAESMFLAGWDIDELKIRFPYIYVFYDNDSTGVDRCTQYTEQHCLNYINIPTDLGASKYEIKDPSDVVKKFNYNMLQDIILDKFERDGV